MSYIQHEVWLHVPTFTTALVCGDFGEFYFNGKQEESFWGLFRQEPPENHGWVFICNLEKARQS